MGDGNLVSVRGILLDVTLDSPAKALWLQMKQFNGYFGCSKCKEKGCQHVIGIGKKGRNRQCHIYPYNSSSSSGHGEVRRHNEVKEQAIQVLRRKKEGAKTNYDIEGVLGLSWAFGIPTFDIIRGTAIDYMHCVCEGVVEQLLNSWFSQDNKDKLYFIGNRIEEVDKEFLSIQPISEVTRTPRSIVDKKDWKASEKKEFLAVLCCATSSEVPTRCVCSSSDAFSWRNIQTAKRNHLSSRERKLCFMLEVILCTGCYSLWSTVYDIQRPSTVTPERLC